MKTMGWLMMIAGAVLIAAGLTHLIGNRLNWLGDFPGDIKIGGRHFAFSVPLLTCIVLSIIITVILNVVFRLLSH